MHGQILHHQCAVDVHDRVVGDQALVGRGDGVQDTDSWEFISGEAAGGDPGRGSSCGSGRQVQLCGRVLVERCWTMECDGEW